MAQEDRAGLGEERTRCANAAFWAYDTTQPGNGNGGHSGAPFGTALAEDQKAALLEYLKNY